MDAVNKASVLNQAAATIPKAQVKPQETAPAEPKDSFMGTVLGEAKEMALKGGDMTSSALGGAVGLGMLTAGLYAGVAGGAIFLGALGGGIGPVIASVSTKGLLGFLGGTFKTVGFFAKAGIVMGGISTGLGGWTLGKSIGGALAAVPGMMIGGAIGLATGTYHAIQNKLGGEA